MTDRVREGRETEAVAPDAPRISFQYQLQWVVTQGGYQRTYVKGFLCE